METKFYPKEKLRRDILAVASKYLDIDEHQVFFFGSRVGREGDERSDIDIGIEGAEKLPLETIARIKEDLSNLPTLYSFDIVDFRRADDDFKKVAKKHIEEISPKK